MSQILLYLFALAAGVSLTLQIGANGTARRYLASNAEAAALLSFIIGMLALLAYMLVSRISWPPRSSYAALPLWAWTGGLLGVFYVVTSTVVGPRIGAAVFLSLVVLGQLLAALLVDQFGWLGFPQQPVTALRAAGAVLLLIGVTLISR